MLPHIRFGIMTGLLGIGLSAASFSASYLEYYNYGLTLLSQGQKEQAAQYFQAALQMNPACAECQAGLDQARAPALAVSSPGDATASRAGGGMGGGGSLPAGSYFIFEEEFHGTLGRSPETSSNETIEEGPARGRYGIRMRRDPTVQWGGFWIPMDKMRRDLGPKGIDLLIQKGAFSFMLKGHNGWEEFSVGFQGPAMPDYANNRFYNEVNISKYGGATKEWRRIVIPFADFAPQGHLWASLKGQQATTHQNRWDWLEMEQIYFDFRKTAQPEQVIYLDDVALMPSYDEAEVAKLKASAVVSCQQASTSAASGTENATTNGIVIFDDAHYGGSLWEWPPKSDTQCVMDETFPQTGKKCVRVTFDTKQWSSAGINLNNLDFTPFMKKGGKVEFWIRGANGGENINMGFKCRDAQGDYIRTTGDKGAPFTLAKYVDVTKKWKKVTVPLSDFPLTGAYERAGGGSAPFSWDKVTDIEFNSAPAEELAVMFYLDEIRVLP